MADIKLSAIATDLTAAILPSDRLIIIDDPAGTPVVKYVKVGNLLTPIFAITAADFTLAAAGGVQSAFPSTCDVITLQAATTYFFEGHYWITCGATTHTLALAFAAGGSLTVTSINYHVMGFNGVVNTTATAQGACWVSTLASTVVTATATTAGNHLWFQGIVRVNVGGTLTPQIAFSANPTGTNLMKADSYIRFTPVGSNTVETSGADVA